MCLVDLPDTLLLRGGHLPISDLDPCQCVRSIFSKALLVA